MRSSATDAIDVSILQKKSEHYAIGRENSSPGQRATCLAHVDGGGICRCNIIALNNFAAMMIRPQPSRSDRRFAVPGSPKPKKTWRKDAGLFAAVLLFIGGSGYGLTHWMAPLDHISDQEKSAIETRFSAVTSVPVTLVAQEDERAARAEMSSSPNERARVAEGESLAQGLRTPVADLRNPQDDVQTIPDFDAPPVPRLDARESISSGGPVLTTILIFDFAAEDGDVMRLSSGRFSIEVTLTKAPQAITVPVDATRTVTFTGVRDGGGGITGAIRTSTNKIIEIPAWDSGQFVQVPVSF
jgi:hypothetical protein